MSSALWQTSSATPSIWPKPSDICRNLGGITNKNLTPALHTAYDHWTTRLLQISATEKPAGVIGNHSSYDEAATKIEKIRTKPNDDNPFFTGTASALRYLRVLKECNLNNAGIERAQRKS